MEYDPHRCALAAVCTALAPEVFALNDDSRHVLVSEDHNESQRQQIQDAADSCPTGAISVTD